MKSQRTTKLKDAEGEEHTYVMIQFGAVEGIDLAPTVIECIAEPIGKVIQAFTANKGFMPAGDKSEDEEEGGVPDGGMASSVMNADVDAAMAGAAIGELSRKIAKAGGSKFMMRLLCHTMRDGEKVGEKVVFNKVYQGNYLELMSAIGWVVVENYAGAFGKMARPFVQGFLPAEP